MFPGRKRKLPDNFVPQPCQLSSGSDLSDAYETNGTEDEEDREMFELQGEEDVDEEELRGEGDVDEDELRGEEEDVAEEEHERGGGEGGQRHVLQLPQGPDFLEEYEELQDANLVLASPEQQYHHDEEDEYLHHHQIDDPLQHNMDEDQLSNEDMEDLEDEDGLDVAVADIDGQLPNEGVHIMDEDLDIIQDDEGIDHGVHGPNQDGMEEQEENGNDPENGDMEMDYNTILQNLKKEWMVTEIDHTVSKVASNAF